MYSNTILKLDLIIIIIQEYCKKYLKPDKDLDNIKKSKTIQFVLDQLNGIRKTKDFKTLKSIFTIEKKYKIKDLKDWLSTVCVNKLGLFSKHFKLDVKIDMTKGYKTYVNLLSKLGNNKTKVNLRESNKKISILFNLLFYSFKNTEIKGGNPETELKQRLLCEMFIEAIKQEKEKKRLIDLARKARAKDIGRPKPVSSASDTKGISKSSNNYWNKVKKTVKNKSKLKTLFLKLSQRTSETEQSKNVKILLKILELKANDLIYKKLYVEYWREHFNGIVPNFMDLFKIFGSNYTDLYTKFNEEIKKYELEGQNCIYLALLLYLWTYKGNDWIYNLLIYKTLNPEHRDLNEFFQLLYANNLISYMEHFFSVNNGDEYHLYKIYFDQIKADQIKASDPINLGKIYMCVLSLLARYFSNQINTKFFTENNNKSINVYFGTKAEVVQKVFNTQFMELPITISQSATRDFETALNFADANKDKDTGTRTIVVYKIKNSTEAIYSAVPLEFISKYPFEQEILLVPQILTGPSDIAVSTIRSTKKLQFDLVSQMQSIYQQQLHIYTGMPQDLIDLGEDPISFIFIGDTESLSIQKTVRVIVKIKKFIKKVKDKFLEIANENIEEQQIEQELQKLDVGTFDDLDLTDLDL